MAVYTQPTQEESNTSKHVGHLQCEGVLMDGYDCIPLCWQDCQYWELIRPSRNVDLEKHGWMKSKWGGKQSAYKEMKMLLENTVFVTLNTCTCQHLMCLELVFVHVYCTVVYSCLTFAIIVFYMWKDKLTLINWQHFHISFLGILKDNLYQLDRRGDARE